MNYGSTNHRADYEAEMAMNDETANWTAEQWAQFELEQDAAADVRAERRTERTMAGGYGWQ